LVGADEFDMAYRGNAFVVYQGTHGDAGAHRADVILPGAAYTEKDGIYLNFEGRLQYGNRATFPPGDAKEDWAILRALSEVVGKTLPYDDRGALRKAILADVPHFANANMVAAHGGADPAIWDAIGREGQIDSATPLSSTIHDFYLTNPIARASAVMAECSRLFVNPSKAMAAE
ncbi:MAG: molybdopterin-dependent oxidoreductase, partial [Alphaproteobacteria bacterium]|nr:molybdopterin-dependent oxidoreductase [Alphaproteobacteria bacterium]